MKKLPGLKKSEDEYGYERSSKELVLSFLRPEKKTFGEIKKFLELHNIRYADNKGLSLLLKNMIKRKEIGKQIGDTYPKYFSQKKHENKISDLGSEFRRRLPSWLRDYPEIPKENNESEEEYFLRRLVNISGTYWLFVLVQSWKLTSVKNSPKENQNIRNAWLREVLPLPFGSSLLDQGINKLTRLGDYQKQISKIYENKEKQKKLGELEQIMRKKHPQETKLFINALAKAEIEYPKTQTWLKQMEKETGWQDKLNKKMKNTPKPKNPNECPRCHYDGKSKVKAGPSKGMIFKKGFYFESSIEKQERRCPACGYRENFKKN